MHFPKLIAASIFLALAVGARSWAGGLTITPIFSSAIQSDPNSAAIEATINSAIGVYESAFTNPVNIAITFTEMSSGLGESQWEYYDLSYSQYYAAIAANANSAAQFTALAHLPPGPDNPVTGTSDMFVKASTLIALGFQGIDTGGNIVSLNTSITNVGSPGTTGQYSLLATTEHEIDEVLGLGSGLDIGAGKPLPEDLFRYDSSGARSFTTSTNAISFFSIDGSTDLAEFNQQATGDRGDWASNPLPPGVQPQVQDAFSAPGANPTLGPNELIALNVIGYNLNSNPEPSAFVLLGTGLGLLPILTRQRRLSSRAEARELPLS